MNNLKFAADRKSVQVVLAKGGETDFLTSKMEAFEAFAALLGKKKITEEERQSFCAEVFGEDAIEWTAPEKEDTMEDFFRSFGGRGSVSMKSFPGGMLIEMGISGKKRSPFGGLLDLLNGNFFSGFGRSGNKKAEKKEARLDLCPFCGTHGHIVTVTGHRSPHFETKEAALLVITEMVDKQLLTGQEAEKLTAEINDSNIGGKHPLFEMLDDVFSSVDDMDYSLEGIERPEIRFNSDKTAARVFVPVEGGFISTYPALTKKHLYDILSLESNKKYLSAEDIARLTEDVNSCDLPSRKEKAKAEEAAAQ